MDLEKLDAVNNDANNNNKVSISNELKVVAHENNNDELFIDNCNQPHSNYKNFEKICESLNEEEKKLEELEIRRAKLEKDMERLQNEIEEEKLLFRKAIDDDIIEKYKLQDVSPVLMFNSKVPKIDPFNLNREEVYAKIEECREAVQESQANNEFFFDDLEIQHLKNNLVLYKKTLDDTKKAKVRKQKRKTAAKIFQKHLQEVDLKCTEQIGRLVSIQKSIEVINAV